METDHVGNHFFDGIEEISAAACNQQATGNCSTAEGDLTVASGSESHAEGRGTTASGIGAHSEGILVLCQENRHMKQRHFIR